MTDQPQRSALDIALDAMPEVRKADASLAALRAHRAGNRRVPGRDVDGLANLVTEAALAGEPIPDDIGQRSIDYDRRLEYAQAEQVVFGRAEALLNGNRENALRVGANQGIIALRAPYAELLDQALALAPGLLGAHSDTDAVEGGPEVFAVWHQFGPLVTRYQEIRREWERLMRAVLGDSVQWTDEERRHGGPGNGGNRMDITRLVGDISNVDQVWPGWLDARKGLKHEPPPWPHTGDEYGTPSRDKRYLVWLATARKAKAWLPTTSEARAAYCTAYGAANQREREAHEIRKYGHVRSTPERITASENKAAEVARRIDAAHRRSVV